MDDETLQGWWARTGLPIPPAARTTVIGGDPVLDCRHRVGEAAAASLGVGAAWAAEIWHRRGGPRQSVTVDVGAAAASLIGFALQQAPEADLARRPPPYTRLFPTRDGRWIHLHGGFPHLAAGLVELLGCDADDESVAAAVSAWEAEPLEEAIAAAGLCGAVARSAEEWNAHPQGTALSEVDAVTITRIGDAPPRERPASDRPLSDVRVADMTRVLAGPTCGRTLAAHGADVLRIASPYLPSVEPYVVETGHGKRNAFADLHDPQDHALLLEVLAQADVVCQSYRPGALDRRGLGAAALADLAPGCVYVSIDCYGHVGPWANRAGWEQLAQTVSGLAIAEGSDAGPRLIPAAATDYTTGYLAAAGALAALALQMHEGGTWAVEVSLCQTSRWLQSGGMVDVGVPPSGLAGVDGSLDTTDTSWGPVTHLGVPMSMTETPPRWDLPPSPLGTHALSWTGP